MNEIVQINNDTINAIGALVQPLKDLEDMVGETEELELTNKDAQKQLEEKKRKRKKYIFLAVAISLMLGISAFVAYKGGDGTGIYAILVAIPFFLPLIINIFSSNSIKKIIKENEEQISINKDKIMEQAKYVNPKVLNIIPPDYRNSYAINFIYRAFLNSRCSTMGDAINLFERDEHYRKMEAAQYRILSRIDNALNASYNSGYNSGYRSGYSAGGRW